MRICLLLIVLALLPPALLAQDNLDLDGYQKPDGAISTWYQGNKVDPYFATKALLIASDGGLKIHKQAIAWVEWAIKRQRLDGLFNRYERNLNGGWEQTSATDADDAMLALWIELLYRLAPARTMAQNWKESIEKAQVQLASLYSPEQGIYYISSSLPVGLLMDNAEIYAAFRKVAEEQRRLGLIDQAQDYDDRADKLGENILRIFSADKDGVYLVSTQSKNAHAFYPDKVASLFPVLYGIVEKDKGQAIYRSWMHANGNEWLAQRKDDYPWGLVALTAIDEGDEYAASCWQNRAEPMRYSKHWNVLEETSLQNIKHYLGLHADNTKIACVGGNLS